MGKITTTDEAPYFHILCPDCGKSVVRYTATGADCVRRNGCDCPRSRGRAQRRIHALRDRRPLPDTGRRGR